MGASGQLCSLTAQQAFKKRPSKQKSGDRMGPRGAGREGTDTSDTSLLTTDSMKTCDETLCRTQEPWEATTGRQQRPQMQTLALPLHSVGRAAGTFVLRLLSLEYKGSPRTGLLGCRDA